jgi:pimeloyl-ACP methyl ester carboxylesterase
MCQPGGIEDWLRNNKTTKLASWITPAEVSTHSKILATGGYNGPLNYYKQGMAGISHASELKINPQYATTRFSIPTLFVGSNEDVICVPAFQFATMRDFFDRLTVKDLDTGHWCMLEKPKELWEIMEGWIETS